MRRVLFDSDILLDVLAQRQPFVVASAQALNSATQEWVEGYVSGHAITNIFYILRRQIGSDAARKLLSTLLERIQVASVTDEVIRSALQSSVKDFEDAVTIEAALAAGLEIIITRNITDFVASPVPVMLPEEFLASLSEST
ncbi:MAG: PIN domain-containing protein [Coleofasciculus sp.]|uniref:PIN domain-containing protein n=1 Tax=Coleofasciculus sp. TaxID=3100458 RepID=UPI003A1B0600